MQSDGNSYEEARKRRVEENLKRFEGLGIATISKSLSEVTKTEKRRYTKRKLEISELRRSSRPRNLITSYRDGGKAGGINYCLRSTSRGTEAYTGSVCSNEDRIQAIKRAAKLRASLRSKFPSFVKSLVRSHVSGYFWLGLPIRFCKDYLHLNVCKIILEDEKGVEYEAIYIESSSCLRGGWKGFALDHDLDEGDAILFELVRYDKFKVYVIRASEKSDLVIDEKQHGPSTSSGSACVSPTSGGDGEPVSYSNKAPSQTTKK